VEAGGDILVEMAIVEVMVSYVVVKLCGNVG
jgi:hypothetical protein